MTIAEYKAAGYEMANQVSEAAIAKAEKDVFEAYVKPIVGSDANAADFEDEIMALAFCLLLRRNVVKTRFGSEEKTNQYGTVMQFESNVLQSQVVGLCVPAIKSLISKTALSKPFNDVSDIIGFGYYKF